MKVCLIVWSLSSKYDLVDSRRIKTKSVEVVGRKSVEKVEVEDIMHQDMFNN